MTSRWKSVSVLGGSIQKWCCCNVQMHQYIIRHRASYSPLLYRCHTATARRLPFRVLSTSTSVANIVDKNNSVDKNSVQSEKNPVVNKAGNVNGELPDVEQLEPADASNTEKPGLFKRFHQTYKQYGKILVCVHIATSAVWTSLFYYAAISGVDVLPLLKWIGASEKMIATFSSPAVGHAAVTYLLYKLATPFRYTVTIGGTQLTVRYLLRLGYLPPIPHSERIRSLMREKYDDIKERRAK